MIKLVKFANKKIKFEDFNTRDKISLVDLFVNNETTYNYIYKSLFQNEITAIEKEQKKLLSTE